jgi:hypothetical protein
MPHDAVDMDSRAVDYRKIRVGGVEHQRQLGPRQYDGINAVALDQRVCQAAQRGAVFVRALPERYHVEVGLVYQVDLHRLGPDDRDIGSPTSLLP